MKKLIHFFTHNGIAKLISLIAAVIIWFLINKQVESRDSRVLRGTMQNESWTD